jgi:hypothetical protein
MFSVFYQRWWGGCQPAELFDDFEAEFTLDKPKVKKPVPFGGGGAGGGAAAAMMKAGLGGGAGGKKAAADEVRVRVCMIVCMYLYVFVCMYPPVMLLAVLDFLFIAFLIGLLLCFVVLYSLNLFLTLALYLLLVRFGCSTCSKLKYHARKIWQEELFWFGCGKKSISTLVLFLFAVCL